MANEQYAQLGWSPAVYVAILAGMAVFTLLAFSGCVLMMYRAAQATAPGAAAAAPPSSTTEPVTGRATAVEATEVRERELDDATASAA